MRASSVCVTNRRAKLIVSRVIGSIAMLGNTAPSNVGCVYSPELFMKAPI